MQNGYPATELIWSGIRAFVTALRQREGKPQSLAAWSVTPPDCSKSTEGKNAQDGTGNAADITIAAGLRLLGLFLAATLCSCGWIVVAMVLARVASVSAWAPPWRNALAFGALSISFGLTTATLDDVVHACRAVFVSAFFGAMLLVLGVALPNILTANGTVEKLGYVVLSGSAGAAAGLSWWQTSPPIGGRGVLVRLVLALGVIGSVALTYWVTKEVDKPDKIIVAAVSVAVLVAYIYLRTRPGETSAPGAVLSRPLKDVLKELLPVLGLVTMLATSEQSEHEPRAAVYGIWVGSVVGAGVAVVTILFRLLIGRNAVILFAPAWMLILRVSMLELDQSELPRSFIVVVAGVAGGVLLGRSIPK